MADSAAGWNAGDLPRFMAVYSDAPDTSFVTLDFRLLDRAHALYIGRYTLRAADGKEQSGMTSLVFRKEAAGWRIIADHSS